MKILHVISNLGIGGAEIFLKNLIASWPSKSDQHYVISFHNGEVADALRQSGISVEILLTSGSTSIFFFGAAFWQLSKKIDEIEPDVVVSSLWAANIICRMLCFSKKIPSFSILHNNTSFLGFFKKYLDVATLFAFQGTAVAVSHSVKKSYQELFIFGGSLKKKIKVIQNGVDVDRLVAGLEQNSLRHHFGLHRRVFVFGAVGRLIPSKGFKNLILAFNRFLQENFEDIQDDELKPMLCIVGDGPEREFLKKMVEDLVLKKHVIFCGNQSKVEQLYYGFSSYISSSVNEGQSLALLEAMAIGLPVIVTSASEGELFTCDLDGIVLESGEIAEIAFGMLKMYTEYQLFAPHAKKRSLAIRACYSIARTAEEYASFILDLMG